MKLFKFWFRFKMFLRGFWGLKAKTYLDFEAHRVPALPFPLNVKVFLYETHVLDLLLHHLLEQDVHDFYICGLKNH